jgi:PIN domain nuclease of toxin-antitoxin system
VRRPGIGIDDRYLLATHVILWAVAQPHRLASAVRDLIEKNEYGSERGVLLGVGKQEGKAGRSGKRRVGLIAQSVVEKLAFVTSDDAIHLYGIDLLDADG